MLPLSELLPGNRVADTAVMVNVELPVVTMLPVVLSMDMLLMETDGETTSTMFATFNSETVNEALLMVVVPSVEPTPAVMVMFRLPVAVNNVLLAVPNLNTRSLAPM